MNIQMFYENFSALKAIIYQTMYNSEKEILIILNNGTVKAKISDIIFTHVPLDSKTEKKQILMAFHDATHENARKCNANIKEYITKDVIVAQNAILDCGNINTKVGEILITIDSINAFTLI